MWCRREKGGFQVYFRRKPKLATRKGSKQGCLVAQPWKIPAPTAEQDNLKQWLAGHTEGELWAAESAALATCFGSEFERQAVREERSGGVPLCRSRRTRQAYVHRYMLSVPPDVTNLACGNE
jgi:hypothetical protein